MQAVSSRFLQAIRGPYRAITTMDVYYGQSLVTAGVPIVDGSITVDRTSKTRRSGNATIGDPTFWPTFAGSPLAPYGAELHIQQGISYPDGSQELVSLGRFRIEDVTQETAPGQSDGGLPVVDFYDRSKAVDDASFIDPIDRSGWGVQSLLTHLVQDVVPYAQVIFDPSLHDGAAPGGTTFDSGRWDAVTTCAGFLNADVYFDASGVCRAVPVPVLTQSTPLTAAVWTMDASTPAAIAAGASTEGVIVSAKRTVSRTGVANFVTVTGAQTGAAGAFTAYAADSDPRSPTYYGPTASGLPQGPYGAVVLQVQNRLLTSTAACQAAANTTLANQLGLARSLEFATAPNPALDAGDIVEVIYPDGRLELHIIDSLTIPLGPSAQFSGQTRTLTYQLTGGT